MVQQQPQQHHSRVVVNCRVEQGRATLHILRIDICATVQEELTRWHVASAAGAMKGGFHLVDVRNGVHIASVIQQRSESLRQSQHAIQDSTRAGRQHTPNTKQTEINDTYGDDAGICRVHRGQRSSSESSGRSLAEPPKQHVEDVNAVVLRCSGQCCAVQTFQVVLIWQVGEQRAQHIRRCKRAG